MSLKRKVEELEKKAGLGEEVEIRPGPGIEIFEPGVDYFDEEHFQEELRFCEDILKQMAQGRKLSFDRPWGIEIVLPDFPMEEYEKKLPAFKDRLKQELIRRGYNREHVEKLL
jgi:hypothetical protein